VKAKKTAKKAKSVLVLEVNSKHVKDKTRLNANVMMMTLDTSADDYWLARVKVSETQAVIAFPKFGIVGIGFEREEDWNTNLPASCEAEQIYDHIKHNRGDKRITKAKCLAAIRMLQPFATAWLKVQAEASEGKVLS
jgi:hypothetical protein